MKNSRVGLPGFLEVMTLPGRAFALLSAVALAVALSACAGDFNPVRDAAVATGLGTERRQAPEFVVQSRPDALDYKPTGAKAPDRALKAKPLTTVKQVEAEMDALRTANEARAKQVQQEGAALATSPIAPR